MDPINGHTTFPANKLDYSASITWQELIDKLLDIYESDVINIEEVQDLLGSYISNQADWKKYAKFDKFKYTRNLVHEGNGKFNMMLLCWAPGNQSSIHDHSGAHCFVKALDGSLFETRYYWPHEKQGENGAMLECGSCDIKKEDVTYMSDKVGLHRIENSSHTDGAVSLHIYSPPFNSCQVFDERTGHALNAPMTFWSKFGEKVQHKISGRRKNNYVSSGD